MSEERRAELVDQALADVDRLIVGRQPDRSSDYVKSGGTHTRWDGSWHFFAYSYEKAFEVLWDAAYARWSRALDYPLLFMCRQSIELWLKAAIATVSESHPPTGHGLRELWSSLSEALGEYTSHSTDGAYPEYVEVLIEVLDEHDTKGDRFRYPIARNRASYLSTVADLEELYRAYSLITGFCDAVHTQMEVERELPL